MNRFEADTITLKLTARELFIDLGRSKHGLSVSDVERLKLARHWIDKMIADEAEKTDDRAA